MGPKNISSSAGPLEKENRQPVYQRRTVNKKERSGLCVRVCLCSCLLVFAHPQELLEVSRFCTSADSLQLDTCTSLVNARQCRLAWASFLDLVKGLVCDYALGDTEDMCL